MGQKKLMVSLRDEAVKMTKATAEVMAGNMTVAVGTMMIGSVNAINGMCRIQIDMARIAGVPVKDTIVDMS